MALYSGVNNASGIATADFTGNGLSDVILSSTNGLTRLYAQPVPASPAGSTSPLVSAAQRKP